MIPTGDDPENGGNNNNKQDTPPPLKTQNENVKENVKSIALIKQLLTLVEFMKKNNNIAKWNGWKLENKITKPSDLEKVSAEKLKKIIFDLEKIKSEMPNFDDELQDADIPSNEEIGSMV